MELRFEALRRDGPGALAGVYDALGLGPVPEAVGLLAHPVFWCAMLPALVLLPYLKQFLPGPALEAERRARRPAAQARRRARAQRRLRAAA